jgi:hypothetical protein
MRPVLYSKVGLRVWFDETGGWELAGFGEEVVVVGERGNVV